VFRVDQSWAAFVIRDSRANHTPVSIGQVNGQDTQVISGLKEGDQVILHPSDRIRDGGRISERPR
jgi:HlyD family secretion protein